MATQADVRRIALALPETVEGGRGFGVGVRNKGKDKGFVWSWKERVAPKKPRVERADVIAVRVANEVDKQMLLASGDEALFTEPHYDGFPAVLVRLPAITARRLELLIIGAWRAQAPRALVEEYDQRPKRRRRH